MAIVYNKDMLTHAGLTPQDLSSAKWSPKDGGAFEKLLARLSRDAKGNDGTSAAFDPKSVVRYGLLMERIDGFGQSSWSSFAFANGFQFNDGLWSTTFHYDDPRLVEAIQWLADLSFKKGFMMPIGKNEKEMTSEMFVEGKGALLIDGSWKIGWYIEHAPFPVGFALLPAGPSGRKSMFNGLSDAIWSGSPRKEEAWQWVKFMGSPACQMLVGEKGVVFPAIPEATVKAKQAHARRGVDVSAFVDIAKPGSTVLFPITDQAIQVNAIADEALEEVLLGNAPAKAVLPMANQDINALFR